MHWLLFALLQHIILTALAASSMPAMLLFVVLFAIFYCDCQAFLLLYHIKSEHEHVVCNFLFFFSNLIFIFFVTFLYLGFSFALFIIAGIVRTRPTCVSMLFFWKYVSLQFFALHFMLSYF